MKVNTVERNELFFCQNRDIEDEYHFVIIYLLCEHIRKQFIYSYFHKIQNVINLQMFVKLARQPEQPEQPTYSFLSTPGVPATPASKNPHIHMLT
jgi:hypothetical protein